MFKLFKKKKPYNPYENYTGGLTVGNPIINGGKIFYPVFFRDYTLPYLTRTKDLHYFNTAQEAWDYIKKSGRKIESFY